MIDLVRNVENRNQYHIENYSFLKILFKNQPIVSNSIDSGLYLFKNVLLYRLRKLRIFYGLSTSLNKSFEQRYSNEFKGQQFPSCVRFMVSFVCKRKWIYVANSFTLAALSYLEMSCNITYIVLFLVSQPKYDSRIIIEILD